MVLVYIGDFGYVFVGLIVKFIGDKCKLIEDLNILKSVLFLCDLMVVIIIIMVVIYIILVLFVGLEFVGKMSLGMNYIVFVLI